MTVAQNTTIRHYAILCDVEGIARLIQGGYLFTTADTGVRRLVAYNSPELTLLGRVDLADEQHGIDQASGLVALAQGRSY